MMYKQYKKEVTDKLDRRALLEQLAEESSELSQAALKCIRAEGLSNNVTDKTVEQAHANLFEEVGDVLIVLDCLGIKVNSTNMNKSSKWKRWAERLNQEG